MKRLPSALAAAAILGLAGPGPAVADAGFLLPNAFTVAPGARVTVIASFSDDFPQPAHPMRDAPFAVVPPNGQSRGFDATAALSALTALEAVLSEPGLHRLTSGERLGRRGEVARVGGGYVRLGPDGVDPATLDPAAPRLSSQTATVSETFVAVGEEPYPARVQTLGRLTIAADLGPSGPRADRPLPVELRFDEAPLAGAQVTVIEAFDAYGPHPEGRVFLTDAAGRATLTLTRTGPFVLLVRHIAPSPRGAETDVRSYSTTLTLAAR